jgi:epoxyqueuosine reductase
MSSASERADRAAIIKAWAREAGFDRAGVAPLGPPEHGTALTAWLERGDQAGMEYMHRRPEARLQPAQILPGGRSAVCVALQYHPLTGADEPRGDLWPRVARYARGRDYHDLMIERLRRLGERIESAFPGTAWQPYVDTGPVLERELAARAGLGAVGKNTNLLHPEAGSWFLLGELFLTLALTPDDPVADLCGSCTRCLEACPTGALAEPFRLDSRRCISYWTIEHRGDLPPPARELVADWVFGCDICQEVCPCNEAPKPAEHPELALPAMRAELDLAALLLISRDEYVERFRGSPMKRAKREGLRRNAAVAMGNRGDPAYLSPLTRALSSSEPVVRRHAAWALGRMGSVGRASLEAARRAESEPSVVAEIERALSRRDVGAGLG